MHKNLRSSRLYGAKGLSRIRRLNLRLIGSSSDDGNNVGHPAPVDFKPIVPTYPWRSVAVHRDGVWSFATRKFVIWIFKKMLLDEKKLFAEDEEILKGATEAFRVVTSAIFPPILERVSIENDQINASGSDNLVPLSDFCDFKLAEFFDAANNKIWKREAYYTLHNIDNARIVSTELVIGGSRKNIDQYGGVMDIGPIILIHKSDINKYSPEWLAECIEDENLTLRYTIEITCTGLCCVLYCFSRDRVCLSYTYIILITYWYHRVTSYQKYIRGRQRRICL